MFMVQLSSGLPAWTRSPSRVDWLELGGSCQAEPRGGSVPKRDPSVPWQDSLEASGRGLKAHEKQTLILSLLGRRKRGDPSWHLPPYLGDWLVLLCVCVCGLGGGTLMLWCSSAHLWSWFRGEYYHLILSSYLTLYQAQQSQPNINLLLTHIFILMGLMAACDGYHINRVLWWSCIPQGAFLLALLCAPMWATGGQQWPRGSLHTDFWHEPLDSLVNGTGNPCMVKCGGGAGEVHGL